ncbi:hypothetical protein TD95_004998 [Thielaviopsis punctulata]|uniref:Peroxisomal biogenesis factor 11 n=1 Tax=Thielaviopsis punctulata TaxID=72032 RepID=A0A0F4ZAC7_9PEZI|nr:hypothetical protein TD95_004998 [Thielaviopsis punctulata]
MGAVSQQPTVGNYLQYVATNMGRDKTMRCLQYYGKFYAWYLTRTNGTKDQIAPWSALMTQVAMVRKVMRTGKFVEHFRNALKAFSNKGADPALRYMTVVRHLVFTLFLLFDSSTVLHALGIVKMSKERAKKLGHETLRFWALAIFSDMLVNAYRLVLLSERAAMVDKKEADGVVEHRKITKERSEIRTKLICSALDITAPTAGLKWAKFDDGLVGLSGIISSFISVSAEWSRLRD